MLLSIIISSSLYIYFAYTIPRSVDHTFTTISSSTEIYKLFSIYIVISDPKKAPKVNHHLTIYGIHWYFREFCFVKCSWKNAEGNPL